MGTQENGDGDGGSKPEGLGYPDAVLLTRSSKGKSPLAPSVHLTHSFTNIHLIGSLPDGMHIPSISLTYL